MKLLRTAVAALAAALCLGTAASLLAADDGKLLANGSFEEGPDGVPLGWKFFVSNGAKASMKSVKEAGIGGRDALRVSNASPSAPHVYASLWQGLRLEKGAKYSVSVWCKGVSVSHLLFIHGKSWNKRKVFEDVGPEWKKYNFEIVAEESEFEADGSYAIRINSDDVTQEALLSSMELTPLNALFGVGKGDLQGCSVCPVAKAPSKFEALDSIPQGAAKIALPSDQFHFSSGKMPEPQDFKAEAAFLYDAKGLILLADVKDSALSTVPGESLWSGDSIQLMIDQKGALNDALKPGDLEIGVSPGRDAAAPESFCYTFGRALSASELEVRSRKTEGGYFLAVRIPWSLLKDVDQAKGVLSANLIVNDNDGQNRRVAFLADGIHNFKSCAQNALLILDGAGSKAVISAKDGSFSEALSAKLVLDGSVKAQGLKLVCSDVSGAKAELDVKDSSGAGSPAFRLAELSLDISGLKPGKLELELSCGGKPVASASAFKRDLFNEFKSSLSAFETKYAAFKSSSEPFLSEDFSSSYLKAILVLSDRQLELLKKDAARACEGQEAAFYGRRGLQCLEEMESLVERGSSMQEELKKGKRPGRYAFNPVSSANLILKDGWMMSRPLDCPDQKELDPATFSGHGHFSKAIADMPLFNASGCNMIQTEFGPRGVIKGENPDGSFKIDTSGIERSVASVLEGASKNNMSVIYLLSPHYFPEWALTKHPELKRDYGFIKYEFNHPYAKKLIEAYLKAAIPVLKSSPKAAYIHSLCVSNEPTFKPSLANEFTRKEFAKYLAGKHGSAEALNKAWGSSFKSFEEAAGAENPVQGKSLDGLVCDFHLFAQDSFSEWHKWMVDIIKREWPSVPLHSKIMIHAAINPGSYREHNIDPEAFSRMMDLNGNDNSFFLKAGGGSEWLNSAMGYSLQRSFKKAQIVNSENHIITDRETGPQPYDFIYSSIFQQFVYGMGASAIWVWEDWDYGAFLKKSDFVGDIYRRPLSAYAVGAASMDAARLAPEIKALFDAEPEIAVVYSRTSGILDSSYLHETGRLFAKLSATGRKIGFISEAQLRDGSIGQAKILFAPGATHFDRKAFEALCKLSASGRLKAVAVGDSFRKDEFGKPLPEGSPAIERLDVSIESSTATAALKSFLDSKLGVLPFSLSTGSQDSLFGVEWKLIPDGSGSFLLSATNYTPGDKELEIVSAKGGSVDAEDLIACSKFPVKFTLKPLQPKLLKVRKEGFFGSLFGSADQNVKTESIQ